MKEINISFRREELEKLPAAELEKILFAELESDSTDRDSVLQILSILEERDSTDASDRPAGAEIAWEKYLASHSVKKRVIPSVRRKPRKWLGAVAAAAIAFVLLMTVPQAVGADSIFDIIGRWTQEIFGFFHASEPDVASESEYIFQTDHPGLQQIYDAVVTQGITQPVVPTWVPEGYELVELKVLEQEGTKKTVVWLNGVGGHIVMSFELYGEVFSNSYPKDKTDAKVYEHAGVEHYITANADTIKTMWSVDNIECLILLNDTEEVLKRLIRSIY